LGSDYSGCGQYVGGIVIDVSYYFEFIDVASVKALKSVNLG